MTDKTDSKEREAFVEWMIADVLRSATKPVSDGMRDALRQTASQVWDSGEELVVRGWKARASLAANAGTNCERCSGSGEDPEGFYDQARGDAGHTHDGPCRACDGSGVAASAGSEPVARADSWTNDQWIDLAQRHANADWDSDTPDGYLNAVKALCNDFAAANPSPPEGMVGGWRPIETAPEGQMVVVGWLDPEDAEHPERHDFDLREDGCWRQWHEHAEHVEIIGGHGVSYTPPYTVWMPISSIPTTTAGSGKGE